MRVNVDFNSRDTFFKRFIQSLEISHRVFNEGECIELVIDENKLGLDDDEILQRVTLTLSRAEVNKLTELMARKASDSIMQFGFKEKMEAQNATQAKLSDYDDSSAILKAAIAARVEKEVEKLGFRSHAPEPLTLTSDEIRACNILYTIQEVNEALEAAKQAGLRVKVHIAGDKVEDGNHLWVDISRPIQLSNQPPF